MPILINGFDIGSSSLNDPRLNNGYHTHSVSSGGYELGRSKDTSRYGDGRPAHEERNGNSRLSASHEDASRRDRPRERESHREGRERESHHHHHHHRDLRDYRSSERRSRSKSREYRRDRGRERGRSRERSPYHDQRHGRYNREHHDRGQGPDYDHHNRRHHDYSHRRHRDDSPIVNFDRYSADNLSPYRGIVLPLEDRQRVLKNWDAAPPGFERITADKAKLTGLFPPPGNIAKITNFVPPTLDPTKAALLAMLTNPTGSTTSPSATSTDGNISNLVSGAAIFAPALAKQARRVYVGGIPATCNEEEIADFFNQRMENLAPSPTGTPYVLGVEISGDRDYAFVDFRSSEEADLACTLHDSVFQGRPLVVRRTRESAFNTSTTVPETQSEPIEEYQIVISGLSSNLKEGHLKFLLGPWGGCKYIRILGEELGVGHDGINDADHNDVVNQSSRINNGLAVIEMEDRSVVESLVEGMKDFQVEEWHWQVRKLPDCINDPELARVLSLFSLTPGKATADPTPIMQLLNLVTWNDLIAQGEGQDEERGEEEYQSLVNDIQEECNQFGQVKNIFIPRPSAKGRVAGIGKVYVEFATVEECMRAVTELAGRTFAERTVLTSYYPLEKYQKGIF